MRLRTLILSAALLLPAPLLAQNAERDSVLASIQGFLTGMRTKDTVLMRQAVDSATRMTLLRPMPAGGIRVVTLTADQFIRVASNPNQPALDEPIRNPIVQIDGPLATVWAEYQVRRAGAVTHCGYDAFHLAKLGGRWKILNVSDTYRTEGCGGAW
ncbi:MAG TPA: nuclear transport factor 2 family protein [Gemmatimonadaceae bacterium]|nr:nuclear transport factor 2 family protein [Gemmatimonadaceae bacterium]